VLVFESSIHRQKRVSLTGGSAEQFAIRHAGPTQALNRADVVPCGPIPEYF
jgi:hypothetical protein